MMVAHCHCLDCQKATGAGHATFAFFPRDHVKVTGALTGYDSQADSGNTLTRSFCPSCGSRMTGKSTSMPAHIGVFLGILDNSNACTPAMSFYAKRLREWDRLAGGIPSFDMLPPQP